MDQPIFVIGYARVSTPKQAQTGESLEAQEKAIRKYCDKKGYTLFPDNKVFKEPYSGGNLFRPAYREILGIIKKYKFKTEEMSLIELGCGRAGFLRSMSNINWKEKIGIEVNNVFCTLYK